MAVLFEFDPTSEDAANSPLEIWATATYAVTAFESPAPSARPQWASSVDTEGAALSSVTHENRQVSLTVEVMSAAGLRTLQAKFAKVTREGGTAKLTFPNGEVVIFDLLLGDSFAPQLDISYYANTGTFCTVEVSLTAKPYGRGPAVTLTDHTETTLPALVFTETGIKGDWYGLGKLVVDNDQTGTSQRMLIWGVESRYLNSSVPLFVQAENTTYITAFSGATTAVAGPAGASGAGSNVLRNSTLGTSEVTLAYGRFTTRGLYNIYARVLAPAANAGDITVRMSYGNVGDDVPTYADSVPLDPFYDGQWQLARLGQVQARGQALTPTTGNWFFTINAKSSSGAGTDVVNVDSFLVVPVAEGSGEMNTGLGGVPDSATATSGGVILTHENLFSYSSSALIPGYKQSPYEGDYLLVPPAGLEARSVRFIVKLTRGEVVDSSSGAKIAFHDTNIDDISARLTYTPRYLVVPEP